MKAIEIEMEALATPCRNRYESDLYSTRFLLAKTPSESCLDATSGNKFNENNVAADDPNGLASLVTQEIHSDSEMAI